MDVRLQDVTKCFGDTPLLGKTNLLFKSGAVTALLGPSGSGKTTLLNIIAGLVAPSSGTVIFGKRDVTNEPAETRQVGYVFQNHALFPHLSVAGNVEFPLRVRGMGRSERRTRARDALKMVEIAALAEQSVVTLSGGQRQRVALARALVAEPDVLLLDEPLSALDPALRRRIREELRSLLEPLPVPVVLVTHDQEDAFVLADEIIVLLEGRIAQNGSPQEVYLQPATEEVARFVGPANYLPDQSGVVRMVRPEDFQPVGHDQAADVTIRVERVQFLGDRWRLLGRDSEGRAIVSDVDKWHDVASGSLIRLRIRTGGCGAEDMPAVVRERSDAL
jgi:ABC-type Fe3+/spermidine/putrescine transport system ATPase subunit